MGADNAPMRPPVAAFLVAACLLVPGPAFATIYMVTNTADAGAGSLREALNNANASAGLDTIRFNIGAGGLQTLVVGPPGLPDINEPLLLDGTSQPGWSGNPIIQLDGSGATGSSAGLNIRGNNATVRGFILHSFPDDGIEIDAITGNGDNNVVTGNWVGINASGAARPNADHGIVVNEDADGNRIGGPGPFEGNVVGSNGADGVLLRDGCDNNVVQGNYIGVLADGVTARPNTRFGIELLDNCSSNTIGGTAAGAGNVIAHNLFDGITVSSNCVSNLIQANRIYANSGLGIDFDNNGVTANDAGDADNGANARLNFPVIYNAMLLGSNLVVGGEARPGAVVEVFVSAPDPSGFGEGQTFVGRGTVTGGVAGQVDLTARRFAFSFPPGSVIPGTVLTATATDASNNTSEFSANATVSRFAVTGTTDAQDGTTSSLTALVASPGVDGLISLREAIAAANNTPGTDSIPFRISAPLSGGVHTISPTTPLPSITGAVDIDGTTEPDFSGTPVVELSGFLAGPGTDGLVFDAGANGSTLRGLVINRFNGNGVRLDASACGVFGNRIGTDAPAMTNRGNGNAGVLINTTDSQIGGTTVGWGNTIAYNGTGVALSASAGTGNAVVANSIYSNTGLGIDLGGNGVTSNDAGDGDSGPNDLLNFPVIVTAGVTGSQIVVEFDLDGPPGHYRVEFHRNPAGADPSGFGEGQIPTVAFVVDHPGGTQRHWRVFPSGLPGFVGEVITPTATVCTDGAPCTTLGSTSEYGGAIITVAQPLVLAKRAFLPGGTPIASGTTLPRGTDVEFMVYVNNPTDATTDVSLSDALQPGFAFIGGTLRYDASTPNCPPGGCTPAQEAAIYSALTGGTPGTEAVDGDVVSFGGSTVRIGNQDAPNAQLDVPAGRVWAVLFRVRMQ